MRQIATIGYEGAMPEAFDAALRAAGVELLVDVRAVAASRRKGFSKSALMERSRSDGREYLHLRDLGDPKAGREAARAGQYEFFREIFAEHMKTPRAAAALRDLERLAGTCAIALLCYERDADACHRSILAAHVARAANLTIVHLRVDDEARRGRAGTNDRLGEGVAAG
ncbi:MAG TPA: DUF488 domain-containing protein [Caulobacteraceae bacterium]|nr:DUF488 domain-containing protein [Caulobacteraceae bacterium]